MSRNQQNSTILRDSTNNKWNRTQEKLLQSWGEQAKGYKWMYNKSEHDYRWWNNIIGLMSIGMAFFTFIITALSAVFTRKIELIVTSIIASAASTALASFYKFFNFNEQADSFRNAGIEFQKFISDLELELASSRKDRTDGVEYMKWSQNKFNELVEKGPFIPNSAMKKFIKNFSDDKFSKPDVANQISSISVRHVTTGQTVRYTIDQLNDLEEGLDPKSKEAAKKFIEKLQTQVSTKDIRSNTPPIDDELSTQ